MFCRKMIFPLCIAILLLAACTPEGDKLKQELQQSLLINDDIQSYYVQGSAKMDPPASVNQSEGTIAAVLFQLLLQEEWQWEGIVAPKSSVFDGTLTVGSQHFPLKYKDNRTYFQLPFIDQEQFYYADLEHDAFDMTMLFDSSKAHDIVQQLDPASFQQTKDGSRRTITVTIEDQPTLEQFAEMLQPLEFIFKLPGHAESDYVAISFDFNEEGDLESETYEWQAGEQSVVIAQQYSNWSSDPNPAVELPEDAVSFAELLQKAKELQEKDEFDAYEQFTPSVELRNDFPEGSEEAAIARLIHDHLTALIEKDRDAFTALFRSTGYARQHEAFFESERKYQFIGMEDLSQKNVNQRQISVRILHKYIDPGDEFENISGLVYTLYKGDDQKWTVQTIR